MGWFGVPSAGGDGDGGVSAPVAAADDAPPPPPPSPPAPPPFRPPADAVLRELAAPRPLAPPPLEPQPWVREVWRKLSRSSVGVARLDLRRPQFLDVEEYDSRNILYTRPGAVRRGPGRPRTRPLRDGGGGSLAGGFLGPVEPGRGGGGRARRRGGGGEPAFVIGSGGAFDEAGGEGDYPYGCGDPYPSSPRSGARLKIMRCWQLRPKGNDLEGARRVDEAEAAAAAKAGGGQGGGGGRDGWWRRAPWRERGSSRGEHSPAERSGGAGGHHHLGLELVSNAAAAGAAEMFGDDDGGGGEGGGGSEGGGEGAARKQQQSLRQLPSQPPPAFSLRAPRPLLDFGLGTSLNLDASRLEPVARLKVAGLVSLHLLGPRGAGGPRLKVARVWRLPGTSMALRLRYECPLTGSALARPWQPPARLLLRLDNGVGSGVHLSPGGLEIDERRVALGDGLSLRAGATVLFPRSLPVPRGAEALRVRVNRLSVKTLW